MGLCVTKYWIKLTIWRMEAKCTELQTAQDRPKWLIYGLWSLSLCTGAGLYLGPVWWTLGLAVAAFVLFGLIYLYQHLKSKEYKLGELDKLAAQLRERVEALSRRLERERTSAWFPIFDNRWKELEKLGKRSQDVTRLVQLLTSEVKPHLIGDLRENLQQCQQLLNKI